MPFSVGSDSFLEGLKGIWSQIGQSADETAARNNVTCSKGCTDCCNLLAIVTLPDGLVLAEYLMRKPDWAALLPKLRAAVLATLGPDGRAYTVSEYFHEHTTPCVFLDTRSRLCTVYEARPVPCRTHYVVSDPKLCAPGSDARVGALDLRSLEQTAFELGVKMDPRALCGPIPLMTITGMAVLLRARGDKKGMKKLRRYAMGLPDPEAWVFGCHEYDKPLEELRRDRGL